MLYVGEYNATRHSRFKFMPLSLKPREAKDKRHPPIADMWANAIFSILTRRIEDEGEGEGDVIEGGISLSLSLSLFCFK